MARKLTRRRAARRARPAPGVPAGLLTREPRRQSERPGTRCPNGRRPGSCSSVRARRVPLASLTGMLLLFCATRIASKECREPSVVLRVARTGRPTPGRVLAGPKPGCFVSTISIGTVLLPSPSTSHVRVFRPFPADEGCGEPCLGGAFIPGDQATAQAGGGSRLDASSDSPLRSHPHGQPMEERKALRGILGLWRASGRGTRINSGPHGVRGSGFDRSEGGNPPAAEKHMEGPLVSDTTEPSTTRP